MTFEELFGNKQPKNYVQAPPEKVSTLDQFFRERTPAPAPKVKEVPNMFGKDFLKGIDVKPSTFGQAPKEVAKPISDEVAAVSEVAPKIEQSKVDMYKSIFQSAPQSTVTSGELPQTEQIQGQYSPATSASNLIDVNRVREQADLLAPEATGTDLAMGLIPLAVDVLTGGTGAGVGVAGDYYMGKAGELNKRKQTLEDKLMEIERARAIAGAKAGAGNKGKFKVVRLVDEATGNVLLANHNENTGDFTTPDGKPLNAEKIRAGYAVIPEEFDRRADVSLEHKKKGIDYTPRLDPETGLPSRIVNEEFAPIGSQRGKLNPKQEKDLQAKAKDFRSTDVYKKPAAALQAATNIDGLLSAASDSKNAAASNSARVQLARMSGDVGALSDSDITRSGGSPSIRETAMRFTNLQQTGAPLTARDIKELREVARIYEANARRNLTLAVEALDNSYVKNQGGVKGAIKKEMEAYIPKGPQRPLEVTRMGKDGKIYTYKLNKKTGQYE